VAVGALEITEVKERYHPDFDNNVPPNRHVRV
jgi:hypothetical protein